MYEGFGRDVQPQPCGIQAAEGRFCPRKVTSSKPLEGSIASRETLVEILEAINVGLTLSNHMANRFRLGCFSVCFHNPSIVHDPIFIP